jgi:catechol 2,3-dioxygenase-like lactoylglutathione lyase family enzyme
MSRYGHIDLRVRDLAVAEPFYDALLPALGFTERHPSERWKVWAQKGELPWTAFAVGSREDVERFADVAREAGARDLSGPKEMPYGPGYYAIFFADPSGNLLEVYFRPA